MALLQTSPSPVAADDVGDVVSASPVAADEFRDVVGRFASGVTVITTARGSERCGMTASAMCSVSLEPAMLLVCINRQTRTGAAVHANGIFASTYSVSTRPRWQRISPSVRRRSSPGSQRRRADSGARCSTMPWPSSSAGLWNRWWGGRTASTSVRSSPPTHATAGLWPTSADASANCSPCPVAA